MNVLTLPLVNVLTLVLGCPGISKCEGLVHWRIQAREGLARFFLGQPILGRPNGLLIDLESIQRRFETGNPNRSERKHGLSAKQFPVSAYIGCSKSLKDLKNPRPTIQSHRPKFGSTSDGLPWTTRFWASPSVNVFVEGVCV